MLVSLSSIIKTQYSQSQFGLKNFRVMNDTLKDSLNSRHISSISIKYSNKTLNPNEYFYGNNTLLPDSCIIFSKDEGPDNEAKVTSTLLFYFFSKIKPSDLNFSTYEPISEKTKKISDSTWIYKSVHQLIVIQ